MKPLTIEQLRALEVGDWVWIKDQMTDGGMYVQICMNAQGIYLAGQNYGVFPNYSHYGKTWLAWKNKEQAEAKGEIVELPCEARYKQNLLVTVYVNKDNKVCISNPYKPNADLRR